MLLWYFTMVPPVEMPWADEVKGILEAYLCGEAVGQAEVDLLFGKANPCGKLAETIPYKLSDNPSYLFFPGDGRTVEYREGVFVGYRYYDTKEMAVRYPFGYGLSYTTFEYSDLQDFQQRKSGDTDTLTVSLKVKNTGAVAGKEVVQLYVSDKTGAVSRPVKELKNFVKVELRPGEEKTVQMELDKRSFAWYNTQIQDWYAATGEYEILVAASSQDIRLTKSVKVISTTELPIQVTMNTTISELLENSKTKPIIEDMSASLMEHMGGSQEAEEGNAASEAITPEMSLKMMENAPLRSMRSFMGMSTEEIQGLIQKLQAAADAK